MNFIDNPTNKCNKETVCMMALYRQNSGTFWRTRALENAYHKFEPSLTTWCVAKNIPEIRIFYEFTWQTPAPRHNNRQMTDLDSYYKFTRFHLQRCLRKYTLSDHVYKCTFWNLRNIQQLFCFCWFVSERAGARYFDNQLTGANNFSEKISFFARAHTL